MSRSSARRYGLVAALALVAFAVGLRPTRQSSNSPSDTAQPRASAARAGGRVAVGATSSSRTSIASGAGITERKAPRIETSRGDVVGDELVIRPAPGSDGRAAAAAITELGGEVVWSATRTGLMLARFATVDDAIAARAILEDDRRIAAIFENRIMEGASVPATADAARALQWHLSAMKVPASRSGAGVTVAVLDSGVAYETFGDAHGTYAKAPDLAGTAFVPGWDFIQNDAHPNDDHGHGTHITSVIAATSGVVGVAPGATILPVKVLDRGNLGTELGLAEGIRFAVDHGADVINLSLSFQPGYFPSRYLQDAVDHAAAHGVVMVAAAGNQGGNVVTYPAGFRDVIAVGSSRIWSQYRSPLESPWLSVERYLRRAEYSNRGQRLDIVAAGGAVDGDANADGLAESVVAQTIAPGQPTQFQYRLWAGTSQAAAATSGVVALMLAANPSLTPAQVRWILGETAAPEMGQIVLSPTVGRGFLRADAAVALAAQGLGTRSRFAAAVRVAMVSTDAGRRGRATVEILDADGRPVPGAQVFGTFTGGAYAYQRAVTGTDGTATFLSPPLGDAPVVAFQVDAVSDKLTGATQVFDRPSGALRIDTCSLQLLSEYVAGTGLGTSPGDGTDGSGLGTSPGDGPGGTGLGTSPGDGTGGAGLGTSPGEIGGTGLGTSPGEIGGTGLGTSPGGEIGGSGLGTSPPGDGTSGTEGLGTSPTDPTIGGAGTGSSSTGVGLGTSPVVEMQGVSDDDAGADAPAESDAVASGLLAIRLPAAAGELDSVILANFSWNGATLPTAVVADTAWLVQTVPSVHIVTSVGQGLGTSPIKVRAQSFDPAGPTLPENAACSDVVIRTFVNDEVGRGGVPVVPSCAGGCDAKAASVGTLWRWATAQGLGTSPQLAPAWSPATGMSADEYASTATAMTAWSRFVGVDDSMPFAAYDALLAAAGLSAGGPGNGATAGDVAADAAPSCGPDLGGASLSSELVADPAVLSLVCTPTY